MNNSELITILTEQVNSLDARAKMLSVALEKLTPSRLSLEELKILNELGMTVPSAPPPDNSQLDQIRDALDTLAYHAGEIKASLETIPADNQKAVVTIKNVMAWDMVGDGNFTDVTQ